MPSCFDPRPCVRGDGRAAGAEASRTDFNPRPCVRGDRGGRSAISRRSDFNPRPCVRGDSGAPPRWTWTRLFQSTPLREGRRLSLTGRRGTPNFNPRPCVRGDLARRWLRMSRAYFNPRPCVRGDVVTDPPYNINYISIHAPA